MAQPVTIKEAQRMHVMARPRHRAGKRARRGQSTLEYILVLAAIVAAIVVAANTLIGPGVNHVADQAKQTMTGASGKLQGGLGL